MTTTRDLIDALKEQQTALGESDGQFARRLGISRQMWQFIRTGERSLGVETIQNVARAFPDLRPLVASLFLPPDATYVAV